MKILKKWNLLYRDSSEINGKPYLGRVKASGVSTRVIWLTAAGIENKEHIKEINRLWPHLAEKEIIQAIRFENSRGKRAGTENYG